jgi:hypothetical protein
MGWNEDCSAARDAKSAVDRVDHEVTMLSGTVDSNRWAAENRDDALEQRIAEQERRVTELERR